VIAARSGWPVVSASLRDAYALRLPNGSRWRSGEVASNPRLRTGVISPCGLNSGSASRTGVVETPRPQRASAPNTWVPGALSLDTISARTGRNATSRRLVTGWASVLSTHGVSFARDFLLAGIILRLHRRVTRDSSALHIT
jgi:hypothetical protein